LYRAEQVATGRVVAIKVLHPTYAKRRDALARFFQEARTIAKIRHHNIVEVLDFADGKAGEGTYLVMELLDGESLATWARPGVTLARALAVLAQICDGLAAAHAVGIVHRDLKPDNVRIVPDGSGGELVKLLDFGVAKLLHREDDEVAHETAAGAVIGTPAYMSPEQAGGLPVDGRADLYSVGTIMYELFCGQPMFTGRSFGEFVRKHLTEAPVPPRQTPGGASMDPRFEALILRCVEKDPARRFASALELRDVLRSLLGAVTGLPALASSSVAWTSAPSPSISGRPAGTSVRASVASTAAATPWWLWLLVCGIAIAVGIVVAAWMTIK
jgi:serine/threonine protein kinase